MKKLLLIKCAFALFILQSFHTIAKNNNELPPILDYYPSCEYESLKKQKVSSQTTFSKVPDKIKSLLIELRKKAQKEGAEALILIDKDINQKHTMSGQRAHSLYKIGFEAIFIKQCAEKEPQKRKLALYNHRGKRTLKAENEIVTIKEFTFKIPEKAKLNHPELTDSNVSLENGIYGVKLGTDYKKVIAKFGDPSVYFSLNENELIISYGRQHWFYFQSDILVKVEFGSSLLSTDMSNKVPFVRFFDNNVWKINNKVSRTTSLEDVRETLNVNSALNEENQLIITSKDHVLTLEFDFTRDLETFQKSYKLNRFSLRKSNHKNFKLALSSDTIKQKEFINKIFSKKVPLSTIGEINVKEQLGNPIAKIILTASSVLNLYNSNLVVHIEDTDLVSILLVENIFAPSNKALSSNKPWFISKYLQGNTLGNVRFMTPKDAYELDGKVDIESENYSLSLYFDGDDEKSLLYSAKLSFF